MTSEDAFLGRHLEATRRHRRDAAVIGPGDDAAALRSPGGLLLLTTDAAEEGVHFELGVDPPASIGRRAIAAAASDIAAMGGVPSASLVSLVAPEDGGEVSLRIAEEVAYAASGRGAELGAPVIGGNLTRGRALALHSTVLGRMEEGASPLVRSGGRPGDALYASGALGGAALGLRALRESDRGPGRRRFVDLYCDPEPRLRLGMLLARTGAVTACIDVSDGLALDLHRLCEASGAGAVVEADRIPIGPGGPPPGLAGPGALELALFGGGDYELLFAAADGDEIRIRNAANDAGTPTTRIGRLAEASAGVRLRTGDGGERPLPRRGWDALGRPESG